jgi:hypothetical protein
MGQHGKTVAFNRVANAASLTMLLIAIAWSARITRAHADGGAVQFEKSAGPFVVTVFTTPTPLRAGPVDISLMVQSRENHQPVLDCQAIVQLRKEGGTNIRSAATHEAAQNKLLYAAQVNVPEPGLWELEVAIEHGDDAINVAGEIAVAPANPVLLVYWRSLALPPLLISLFAVNQWLKRRSGKGYTR